MHAELVTYAILCYLSRLVGNLKCFIHQQQKKTGSARVYYRVTSVGIAF